MGFCQDAANMAGKNQPDRTLAELIEVLRTNPGALTPAELKFVRGEAKKQRARAALIAAATPPPAPAPAPAPPIPEPVPEPVKPRRCTAAEHEERVEYACTLLATLQYDGQRKRALEEKYQIAWRQADRYLHEARAKLKAASGRTPQDWMAEFATWLQAKMYDPSVKDGNQLIAQKQLAKLLGLGGKTRPDGERAVKGRVEELLADPAFREVLDKSKDWAPAMLEISKPEEEQA
jgi:hypothetical protein